MTPQLIGPGLRRDDASVNVVMPDGASAPIRDLDGQRAGGAARAAATKIPAFAGMTPQLMGPSLRRYDASVNVVIPDGASAPIRDLDGGSAGVAARAAATKIPAFAGMTPQLIGPGLRRDDG
jgi:hypothetical protein